VENNMTRRGWPHFLVFKTRGSRGSFTPSRAFILPPSKTRLRSARWARRPRYCADRNFVRGPSKSSATASIRLFGVAA
jgi:hypothetical protein